MYLSELSYSCLTWLHTETAVWSSLEKHLCPNLFLNKLLSTLQGHNFMISFNVIKLKDKTQKLNPFKSTEVPLELYHQCGNLYAKEF